MVKAIVPPDVIAHRLVVRGRPVSQKNSKEIARGKDGRTFIVSNPKVKSWRKHAEQQLVLQWGADHLNEPMSLLVVSYQGNGQSLDCDNLAAAPMDALQAAGVVRSDYLFDSVVSVRRRDRDDPRVELLVVRGELEAVQFRSR